MLDSKVRMQGVKSIPKMDMILPEPLAISELVVHFPRPTKR